MNKILIIGESCLDVYQHGDSNRLAPEAPVPVFRNNGVKKENGGMAMNVYNNIKAISNIDTTLITNENYSNVQKIRFVDTRTNYVILRLDENDDNYEKQDVRKYDYSNYDAVIISDYNKGFLTKDDIYYISTKNNKVFLDTKKILGPWASLIAYIKINQFEYESTKEKITDDLRQRLIITLGPGGAKYRGINYPVPKVEIKDTCGAGDTFLAGLVVEYVKSLDIGKAIRFANSCATKVVQKKGVSIV